MQYVLRRASFLSADGHFRWIFQIAMSQKAEIHLKFLWQPLNVTKFVKILDVAMKRTVLMSIEKSKYVVN